MSENSRSQKTHGFAFTLQVKSENSQYEIVKEDSLASTKICSLEKMPAPAGKEYFSNEVVQYIHTASHSSMYVQEFGM